MIFEIQSISDGLIFEIQSINRDDFAEGVVVVDVVVVVVVFSRSDHSKGHSM